MQFFVTGVTGNVGSAILRRLLQNPEHTLWLLIRGKDDEHVQQRLRDLFTVWDIPWDSVASRIRPLRGDMAQPRFGLPDDLWNEVAANCTHIIHAAGVVRMNLPIDQARRLNVDSTRTLTELAKAIHEAGQTVDVAFISTVGIVGKQRGLLMDDWVPRARGFHNTYEQSKAEAENLLEQWARPPGIRLTVHRPSMVVGASDGNVLRHQVFYYICDFLSGRHTGGIQPRLGDAALDTVPIAYVADAVIWANTHPEADGRVFNLCSGTNHEIPLKQVATWTRQTMRREGIPLPPIRKVPRRVLLRLVHGAIRLAPPKPAKRLGTLPVLINYLTAPQVFFGQNTRRYLEEHAALKLPEPHTYLPEVIDRFFARR